MTPEVKGRGVVVGCFETGEGYVLSGCGQAVDGQCEGKLKELMER